MPGFSARVKKETKLCFIGHGLMENARRTLAATLIAPWLSTSGSALPARIRALLTSFDFKSGIGMILAAFEPVTCITQPMNGFELLVMSLRLPGKRGYPSLKQGE
jgi:hypothetical protein